METTGRVIMAVAWLSLEGHLLSPGLRCQVVGAFIRVQGLGVLDLDPFHGLRESIPLSLEP